MFAWQQYDGQGGHEKHCQHHIQGSHGGEDAHSTRDPILSGSGEVVVVPCSRSRLAEAWRGSDVVFLRLIGCWTCQSQRGCISNTSAAANSAATRVRSLAQPLGLGATLE